MNKVHFSNSWQSEKNGTRNEMKEKKKKKREEMSHCLPASAAKWTYLESNPFPQLTLRPFSLLLSSFFSSLILCLARFINPVCTERLGQPDTLTKCTYICTYTYIFQFLFNKLSNWKKTTRNICGFFSYFTEKKKKSSKCIAFKERTKQKLFTDTWSLPSLRF